MDIQYEKRPLKAPKRTGVQLEADAAFIEHYAVMGKTVRQIAEILNKERAKAEPPYSLSKSQVAQVQFDPAAVRGPAPEKINDKNTP